MVDHDRTRAFDPAGYFRRRYLLGNALKGAHIQRLAQFETVETFKEIEVPIGAAELAVGDHLQAGVFLQRHHVTNAFILDRT